MATPVLSRARVLVIASAVVALLAGAGTLDAARRHTRLVRSVPARDTVITAVPAQLQLWFSERIELPVSRVRLDGTGSAGTALTPLSRGDGADAPVTAPLPADLADGRHVVHWSTASKDGHVVRDSFAFTLRRR